MRLRGARLALLLAPAMIGGAPGLLRADRSTAAAAVVRPEPAPRDTVLEEVLLELRIGRLAARTVPAVRDGDAVLLPLTEFLELAEYRHRVQDDGSVEVSMEPGARRITLHAPTGLVELSGRDTTVGPTALRTVDGQVYVARVLLERLMDVQLVLRWDELSVDVVGAEHLPIARRAARLAARASLRTDRPAGAAPPVAHPLEHPAWQGAVLDYFVSVPTDAPGDQLLVALGLGLDVLGGSLEGTFTRAGRHVDGRGSWLGVWREGRLVRQLRLGDGIGSGPHPQPIRGALLTNSPYVRAPYLGVLPYGGTVPPGWEIEAYRGGALVGFATAGSDGAFALPLPIQYGENPVDFVAYGPFGEEHRFNRAYQVANTVLPARRFEYGLSAGRCGLATCRAIANADARYGVHRRWTVGAGVDHVWSDSAADRAHLYAALVGNPVNALRVEAEAVAHGWWSGALHLVPTVDARLTVSYTAFDVAAAASPLYASGLRSRLWASAFLRPGGSRSRTYVEARYDRADRELQRQHRAELRLSSEWRRIRFVPYAGVERSELQPPRDLAGFVTFVHPPREWGRIFAGSWASAAVEAVREQGIRSASLLVSRRLPAAMRIDAGVRWQHPDGAPQLTLTLARDQAVVRSYSTAYRAADGSTGGIQQLQGSVIWNGPARRVALTRGPSLQRAGLTGRVYRDANANGRFDDGEELLSGVLVRVGYAGARTDSSGVFQAWDVVPFEPLPVQVDSLSLPSPMLVPLTRVAYAELNPNRFRSLDLPIVAGAIIEGAVVRDVGAGATPVPGAKIRLVDVATGVEREALTFTDGAFFLMGIPPGEYRLELDREVLDRLESDAAPLVVNVPAQADGAEITGLEVRLTPRGSPAGESGSSGKGSATRSAPNHRKAITGATGASRSGS